MSNEDDLIWIKFIYAPPQRRSETIDKKLAVTTGTSTTAKSPLYKEESQALRLSHKYILRRSTKCS